jgi:hypothetical protein
VHKSGLLSPDCLIVLVDITTFPDPCSHIALVGQQEHVHLQWSFVVFQNVLCTTFECILTMKHFAATGTSSCMP